MLKKQKVVVLFTGLMALGIVQRAHALEQAFDEGYYTIDAIEVSEVSDENDGIEWDGRSAQPFLRTLDEPRGLDRLLGELEVVDVIVDKVISIGTKVWKLVEDNKPVVSVSTLKTSVLPQGARDWRQLSGWKAPQSRVYRIAYKNLYGMTVIDYSFRINYTAGGSVKGTGQYLSNISVNTANLEVLWGYRFNASVEAGQALNMGRTGRPIAGQELTVKWEINTAIKHSQSSASYFIRGTGELADLTHGSALY
jgi:hypothetical protein